MSALFPRSILLWALLVLLGACSPPGPTSAQLVVLPASLSLEVGASPAFLEATVLGSSAPVRWRLEGPGTLSSAVGQSVRYTPPETLSTPQNTQVVATLEGTALSQTVPITLKSQTVQLALVPPVSLEGRVRAGGAPLPFSAQRSPESAGEVQWSLEGPGQLSRTRGSSTDYTPPPTVDAPVSVVLRAKLGTLERSSTFRVWPPPSLSVTPEVASLKASGPGVAMKATLLYSDDPISWVQDPPFVGTLSSFFAAQPIYTPPEDVDLVQTVKLTAYAAGLTRTALLTIAPRPRVIIALPGVTPIAYVSQGPYVFHAYLRDTTKPVVWSLEPNLGRLEQGADSQITYFPPRDLAQTTLVTFRAHSSELDAQATIRVVPLSALRFSFNGQDRLYVEDIDKPLGASAYSPYGENPSNVSLSGQKSSAHFAQTTFLWFNARNGQTLSVGTYLEAKQAFFGDPAHPGLELRLDDYVCHGITGQFTIKRLELEKAEVYYRLAHFVATFTQTCAGGEPSVSGSVIYGPLVEVKAANP